MKEHKTEQEMRDEKVPWPKTIKELVRYINELTEMEHDYGTCVYAMSHAAVAAFNYVSGKLGVTGFQASCADLDILRHTRSLDGPFAIVNAIDMLCPQHDIMEKVGEYLLEWKEWARKEAQKKIDEHGGVNPLRTIKKDDGTTYEMRDVHPDVWEHWQLLANRP